jgi:hypothetical protein
MTVVIVKGTAGGCLGKDSFTQYFALIYITFG